MSDFGTIRIKGARLHNLKNIQVDIPKNKLVVFTGVSGSGKSSLAMDTLYQESARRYIESLGFVSMGMNKPPVDSITGLSPSISVDQHPGNRSPRSTVGTSTEVFTYLRVLFARLGHRPCPSCGKDVPPDLQLSFTTLVDDSESEEVTHSQCPHCGQAMPGISMTHFSFNKPEGACPTCTGLGEVSQIVEERCIDPTRSLKNDGVLIWDAFNKERLIGILIKAGEYYGFQVNPDVPIDQWEDAPRALLYYGVEDPRFLPLVHHKAPPSTVLKGNFEGVITNLQRRYSAGLSESSGYKVTLSTLFVHSTCPECQGTRLRKESRAVTISGKTIIELSGSALTDLRDWLSQLAQTLTDVEQKVARPIIQELEERLNLLIDIGVGYLTIDRGYTTLSAGEGQRLRLAALLGCGLTGMLYVLDEPTIGLHQRDTAKMIRALYKLRDLGNTVLVIEHDLEIIRAADYVIEFGPGAGKLGGEIITVGSPQQIAASPDSPTGWYLSGIKELSRKKLTNPPKQKLIISGAREHNLKNIQVEIPLQELVAITGVSGSGKSSLMFDILDNAARRHFQGSAQRAGEYDRIDGWEYIQKVITVDQTPIGRLPRSNAATYTDLFTPIRQIFAQTDDAKKLGLTARHFSFNVPGGRCERCEGAGVLTVNMHFMPDVQVRCPVCAGKRFQEQILSVHYQSVNIAEVLEMTIHDARNVFQQVPAVFSKLDLLEEVGLGYLQLGQPATTLSGGESQRVKLAKELTRPAAEKVLYLLDEPTTGLHLADVEKLLALFNRLVKAGHSVVVVEHHLDLIHCADWVIDLGPEGGSAGGYLVGVGSPEQLMQIEKSYTGQCLLARHSMVGRG